MSETFPPNSTPENTPPDLVESARDVYGPRISWGAIIAGVVCGISLYILLNIIGISVGFSIVDPTRDANPLSGIATAASVWWVISSLLAFFVAGLVTARFAGIPRSLNAALHGATVWAIGAILLAWFATTAIGSVVTGSAGLLASLVSEGQRQVQVNVVNKLPRPAPNDSSSSASSSSSSGATGAQSASVQRARQWQSDLMQEIRNEASSLFSAVISPSERRRAERAVRATYADVVKTPGDASEDLKRLYQTLLGNDGVLGADDERQAKQYLMQRLELPQADADRVLANWKEQYEKATSQLQQAVSNLRKEVMPDDNAPSNAVPGATGNTEPLISENERERTAQIVRTTANEVVANPTNAIGELQQMLDKLFARDGVFGKEDYAQAKALLKRQTGISEAEAEQVLNRWQQRYQAAVAETGRAVKKVETATLEAAEATTDAIATASAWAAVALILACFAAVIGGMLGRPEDWLHLRAQVRDLRGPRGTS